MAQLKLFGVVGLIFLTYNSLLAVAENVKDETKIFNGFNGFNGFKFRGNGIQII